MESISQNREFQWLYKRGAQALFSGVVIYARPTKRGYVRAGITASKKIGNAVKRNRARRVIRAALSGLMGEIDGSFDIVLVARVKTTFLKSTVIQQMMRTGFVQLGLISQET